MAYGARYLRQYSVNSSWIWFVACRHFEKLVSNRMWARRISVQHKFLMLVVYWIFVNSKMLDRFDYFTISMQLLKYMTTSFYFLSIFKGNYWETDRSFFENIRTYTSTYGTKNIDVMFSVLCMVSCHRKLSRWYVLPLAKVNILGICILKNCI